MIKLLINQNQIISETERALLIKLPNEKSKRFFFPKKLVKNYGKRYILSVFDDFEFTILSGKKEVTRTVEDVDYITERLQLLEDSNLLSEKVKEHVPDKIEPIERVVEDEFIR